LLSAKQFSTVVICLLLRASPVPALRYNVPCSVKAESPSVFVTVENVTQEAAPQLHIPGYMSLEQAMDEVRRYLEVRNRLGTMPLARPTMVPSPSTQLTLQGHCIARLREIAARLGEREEHSEWGAPGVLAKRLLRKLIGWYLRPAKEFDHVSIEAFQQIRQDMVGIKQQLEALERTMNGATEPAPSAGSNYGQLLCSLIEISNTLLTLQTLRQSLANAQGPVPAQFESLLEAFEDDLRRRQTNLLTELAPKSTP